MAVSDQTSQIDRERLEARFRGLIPQNTVIEIYLEESPPLIRALTRAEREPIDFKQLAMDSHRLKGSLAMLCADHAVDVAAKLSQACRNEDARATREYYKTFLVLLHSLRLELESMLSEQPENEGRTS